MDQVKKENHSMSCIYILGAVGSAVYFISQAATFGAGVVGFLKALVWPVFLVHGMLKFYNI